ncbi:MAG: T3SS effector HopA1 family protein [Thermoleophilia bacterium]
MTGVRRALAGAAAALDLAPGVLRWFGVAEPVGPGRDALVAAVRERLYADWYRRGGPAPLVPEADAPSPVGATPLASRIDAVRGTAGSLQDGGRPAGHGRAVRDGLHAEVAPGDLIGSELRLPGCLPGLVPGYHLVLGRRDLDGRIDGRVMRAYLHATPRGAATLAAVIGAELDRLGIAFRMKLLSDPAAYRRCDAAVLYARMDDAERVVAALRRRHPDLAPHLRPTVPVLTLRLAPGIGWAEDPGGLDSFGHHRCGLLADGLVRAMEFRAWDPRGRVRRMEAALAAAGIDPRRPHLGPGSPWAPEPFA